MKNVYAIHEASGQDLTFSEKAYALVTNGGKPGQGFPCILISEKNVMVMSNAKQKAVIDENISPTLLAQMGDKTSNVPIITYRKDT